MKKILALCLSICLLLGCLPLVAAAYEGESEAEKSVASLLTQSSTAHVKNGLVYNYVSNGTAPLALGNGKTLEAEKLFNVLSYQADPNLHDVEYDYSITGRFSFSEIEAADAWAKIGPLSIFASAEGGTSLNFSFGSTRSSVTASLPSTTASDSFPLLVIAKMKPFYANDGALQACTHTFLQLITANQQLDADALAAGLASTVNVKMQGLLLGESPVNVYSIQVYDRALSTLDYVQNLFADVVCAYGLTALDPSYMTDAARQAYIMPLLSVEDPYALTKEDAAKRLDDGAKALEDLDDIYDYSAFLLNEDDENAGEFWAESHNELLSAATEGDWNILPYFALDEAHFEAFHNAYFDIDELSEKAILDLIDEIGENPYAALCEAALKFDGYQARLEGNAAIRARFSVDNATVEALEQQGLDVSYGAILQDESGYILNIAECYGENPVLDPIFTSEETDRFALTVETEENSAEELAAVYTFSAFVSVNDGEFIYTTVFSCANEIFGANASIASVCTYFYENGYADAPAVALGAAKSITAAALASETKENAF